jgi:hypothetical protein
MVVGAAYTERGDIQLAEPLMKHAYHVLSDGPLDDSDVPVFAIKYVTMYYYAQWADEAGQHELATALWDEIYRVRRTALQAAGVRRDAVIDPEISAIRSRIMSGDLSSAAERLADVKRQLDAGRPKMLSTRWDPRREALALEVLMSVEAKKFSEARRLIGERNRSAAQDHGSDMLIYTLWPTGFEALRALIDCGSGNATAGLDALTSLVRAHQDRLAPDNPTIAYLRSQAGLCALSAGQPARAREMQQAARRAFSTQAAVSQFYKKPLIELERQLARRQLAVR